MAMLEDELVKAAFRGFSRIVILWFLSQKTLSGYGVSKELNKLTGWSFHSGVVYPLLYELEENKLITGRWVRKGRRRIKYYSATKRGLMVLERVRELLKLPVKEVLKDFISEA
ncbi:PadR family transcriptional regulator [Candidatus Bathyarchaeota archaeon]|nr:PadR family transcriptional regulator [Candidatus Bathyarchaeota archaeon]